MAAGEDFVPSQPRAGVLHRLRRRAFALVPVTVWIGSILAVLCLAREQARPLDYPGLALVARYAVHAPTDGQLEQLLVGEHVTVAKGDVIGQLSGAALELRAQQVRHVVEELRAEVSRERERNASERENQRLDWENDARRFARDVEDSRLDLLEVEASVEEARIRLTGLQIDLERQRGLSSERLFSEADLIRTKTEYDALKERIERSEAVIKARRGKIGAVEARLTEYRQAQTRKDVDVDKLVAPFRWRISAQEIELELIALERKNLVLRAPAAGRVEVIHVRPGERVVGGGSVVTIVDPRPPGIVAYLPAAALGRVKPGMAALMERSTVPGTTILTRVLSVGPLVEELPEALRAVPTLREWRVPVRLEFGEAMVAMPGEHLRVRILAAAVDGG